MEIFSDNKSATSGKILVLKGEEGTSDGLGTDLERTGHEVSFAEDIPQALSLLEEKDFDIFLLDFPFSEKSGFDSTSYILEFHPRVRLVVMVPETQVESAFQTFGTRRVTYLQKPVSTLLLCHAISKVLEEQVADFRQRLAEDRYWTLVEELEDGYILIEGDKIGYANRAMGILIGIDPTELVGKEIFDIIHPVAREIFEEKFMALGPGDGNVLMDQMLLQDSNGRSLPMHVKLYQSAKQLDQGFTFFLCRDMREKKNIWNELIRVERLALVGEMMAGLAHELNNKLTPIIAYTEMLSLERLTNHVARQLDVLRNAALGAKNIVESLLLVSSGKSLTATFCDVNELIDLTMDLVSSSFSNSSVRLEVDLSEDLPRVRIKRHQIEQVLMNLLKNAYEAVGNHGLIRISTMATEDDIYICVSDTGPGIPEGLVSHVFDPFFSTKDGSRGCGLGLSISKEIIEAHDGDMAICSREGQGTVFCIRLPMRTDEPQDRRPAVHRSEQTGLYDGKSILIVEDDSAIASLLEEILSERFEVETASNGMEALSKLENRSFDLIVSDIQMPEMNGMELYQRLVEKMPWYCKRIVYTTGGTFRPETRKFLADHKVPHLQKPFRITEVHEVIEVVLSQPDRSIP